MLAIRLLGRGPASQPEDVSRLGEILRPQFSAPVQQAALDRLKQINNTQVGETLLAGWKNYGPSLRTEVLSALLSRIEWVRELLEAIQSGRIAAAEVRPNDDMKRPTIPPMNPTGRKTASNESVVASTARPISRVPSIAA